jgi:hypothetical protein
VNYFFNYYLRERKKVDTLNSMKLSIVEFFYFVEQHHYTVDYNLSSILAVPSNFYRIYWLLGELYGRDSITLHDNEGGACDLKITVMNHHYFFEIIR